MTSENKDLTPTDIEQVQMLFVRHESAIRAFVRALLPSFAEADDVLQETFLTVSRRAESFEIGTNFVAWACGIARLKVLEHYRQHKRATLLSEAAIIALADDAPQESMIQSREAALVLCLEKIAPKARDLLWRRYTSRQSSVEIATGTGMTSTAVRVALSKTRAFLRDCVSRELRKAY
jgi:RNA polymerase sigma-70 factor, ECF subfamily